MLKTYGDRYRHPKNADLESAVAKNLPYLDFDEATRFYAAFCKGLKIDRKLTAAAAAGQPAALAKLHRCYSGLAFLGCNDRFFLLTRLCGRTDAIHPWLFDRCREVEQEPDGHLDLWSRFHYKSTIITFAGCIQEIVRDPEIKIAIFSAVKPIAQAFLGQIKDEFENDELLKCVYSDVLYRNPRTIGPDGRPSKWGVARHYCEA